MMRRPFTIGETVSPAVHHLLDGEKGNQNAADWNGDVKRCDRRHRWHAQAFEAVEKVQVTEVDHAKCDTEHDRPVEKLEEQAAIPAHRFGKHSEVEMVVAAGHHGNTKKNSIEEERHGRLLGKKPGVPQGAQNHVRKYHDAEAGNRDPAEDHQKIFEWIERSPFQMALLLQNQAIKAHRLPEL